MYAPAGFSLVILVDFCKGRAYLWEQACSILSFLRYLFRRQFHHSAQMQHVQFRAILHRNHILQKNHALSRSQPDLILSQLEADTS